jgi:hypothetical protein
MKKNEIENKRTKYSCILISLVYDSKGHKGGTKKGFVLESMGLWDC